METWKPVPDFEYYEVSDHGNVRSLSRSRTCLYKKTGTAFSMSITGRTLSPRPDKDGYLSVILFKDKKRHTVRVHHLVLLAFIGPQPIDCHGCHLDGNNQNNDANNLEWNTCKANAEQRVAHGTQARGVRQHLAKLDDDKVREIRRRRQQGETLTGLGRCFHVSHKTIEQITKHQTWTHVA